MQRILGRLIADENGGTAVEYGLVVSLIGVAIVVVLGTIGVALIERLEEILESIENAGR